MKNRALGTLLQDSLELSANRLPKKTALLYDRKKYTYTRLNTWAEKMANAFRRCGVEEGDRIAICMDNSVESIVAIYGALKAGAVFVVINTQMKPKKLCFILNDCRAKGIVIHSKHLATLQQVEKEVSSIEFAVICGEMPDESENEVAQLSAEDIFANESSKVLDPETIDLDLAAIIYTSGTTGFPKGVCFSHRSMVSISHTVTGYLENLESDIILNVLPFSHGYGLYQALMSIKMGAKLILKRSFMYPQKIIQAFEKERVTGFAGVPTIYAIMLQIKDIKNRDFSAVRYLTNAAAALPPRHIEELREVFPNAKIYSMYGVTECKRVSYLPPDQLTQRPNSVGKGMPNQEVSIVDENGQEVGPGVVGELAVRGANVMMGYWERPEENEKVLRPGRYPGERVLYTGDLFKKDEEGYLYFVSRKDDIIKCRGEKVAPKEIESHIYEIPQVLEAAVVGVDDDILGQAIKAYIVLKNGAVLKEREVIRHCAQGLESLMVPKYVEFISEMPKTASGKIRKKSLLEKEQSDSE